VSSLNRRIPLFGAILIAIILVGTMNEGVLAAIDFDSAHAQIEIIDSNGEVGKSCSIALDSDNQPHISYYDNTNDTLKYAFYDGVLWHIETLNAPGNGGIYTSIALDSNDHPHISYYNEIHNSVKYASYNGIQWQIETVISEFAKCTSIALDSNNRPHIIYCNYQQFRDDGGYLKYAHNDGNRWYIETVASIDVYHTSLVLDSNDRPHISYNDWRKGELKYANFDGSLWHKETVDLVVDQAGSGATVGHSNSIIVDSKNRPHISYEYSHPDGGSIRYAYNDGEIWIIKTVYSRHNPNGDTSIGLDGQGRPIISYRCCFKKKTVLKYAYYDGNRWLRKNVDSTESGGGIGYYNSLAVGSDGKIHICYSDTANGNLKYAVMDRPDDISKIADKIIVVLIIGLAAPVLYIIFMKKRKKRKSRMSKEDNQT